MLARIIQVVLIFSIAAGSSFAGAATEPVEWLEGNAFYEQLAEPLGATWSDARLADVAAGLSRTYRTAIVLDRRVDPNQAVTLSVSDRPLIDVLVELARRQKLGLYLLGPIVCLCPADTATGVEAAARARGEEARRLPRSSRRRWSSKASMSWEELGTPAELLLRLAKQGGFEIVNPELLPHDLWAAGNLPKLTLADRLSFILGQFGLTYDISRDAKLIRLVAIPETSAVADWGSVGSAAKLRVEKWKAGAKRMQAAARSKKSRKSSGKKVIRIEKFAVEGIELEPLLEQLASQLDLTLELDRKAIESAGISLKQRITVSLERVTPEELFEEVLSPVGLRATFSEKRVRIEPK